MAGRVSAHVSLMIRVFPPIAAMLDCAKRGNRDPVRAPHKPQDSRTIHASSTTTNRDAHTRSLPIEASTMLASSEPGVGERDAGGSRSAHPYQIVATP